MIEEDGDGVTTSCRVSSLVRNVLVSVWAGCWRRSSSPTRLLTISPAAEIEIMRLVGASNWFIRWPFFIEGAFIGMLGAVFPVIIVLAFYKAALNVLTDGSQYSFIKMLPMMPLSLYVSLLTTFLGVLIGVWGSVISIRRFLKV